MKKSISSAVFLSIAFLATNLFSQNLTVQERAPRVPLKIIDRSGIMPTGIIQIETTAKMSELKRIGFDVKSQFGIVNHLQGQLSWDGFGFFTRKQDDGKIADVKRTLNIGAKYEYFACPHISLSAQASMPIHIFDGEIVRDVTFGLPTVFYNDIMAGGVLGDLFHLTMRRNIELEFKFPFWYGVQVYGNWWAMLGGSFGEVAMKNKKNDKKWHGKGLWEKLPLDLTVSYAFNPYLDLSGFFGFDDVFDAKNSMFFGLTLAVRGGRLFG